MISEAERIAAMLPEERAAFLSDKPPAWFIKKQYDWGFWRRSEQAAPEGDWRVWMMLAGRGFGKTRAGAEWVRGLAEARGDLRIALVAATLGEARQIMVEGESGLLSLGPEEKRPTYNPSLRQLSWKSGAIATLYGASEPESLRGPEHHFAWCDEIAKWEKAKACWDNLGMTMRLGNRPQIVATTTPRQVAIVRHLCAEHGVVVTRGRSGENDMHLASSWLAAMRRLYGGTRLGRQELEGELIEDIEDALWSRDLIERCRAAQQPEMRRVVIGVDPPASAGGDACGIVAVGLGHDGKAYVLADCSVEKASPDRWARAVAAAAEAWGADKVIAEANQGGDMVASTLRAADISMPVKLVHASRGKVARAEPVAALFEGGRALFVGAFPELEDELCGLVSGGGYEGPGRSPDRADACVWAMSELMLGRVGMVPRVRWL